MGRKKKREQTVVQSFCLEKELLDKLSEEAKKRGMSRSALLEDIVKSYFEHEPIDIEKALEPFFNENAINMDKVLESFLGDKPIDIDSFVIVDKEKEENEKVEENDQLWEDKRRENQLSYSLSARRKS